MTATTATIDLAQHKARAKAAWSVRDEWQKVLLDAYDFVAPHRMSTRMGKKSPGNRTDRIFDNTGVVSLQRSAGRLQKDLFPPGEPFFALEPGPAIEALGGNKDDAARELEAITSQITPVFLTGEWDQAVQEMLTDVMISMGFMMIIEGDDDQPVRFVNASCDEIAVDQGPYNTVTGIFWKRKWTYRAIKEAFPKGKYDATFEQAFKAKPEEEVELNQDTIWIATEKRWRLCVYLESNAAEIHCEEFRECPWITPRYFRLPGQVYGFGPVLMALPTIKTLNKAQELTLKAAAIAMAGIYTRIDDGVFNPDTARIEPGAFWSVARNGGVLGPSLQKLPPPGDLNLSNLVLQDLRMQVQAALMDQQMPPDAQTPRSAAEIVERIKRLAQDHAGAFGRLVHECVVPVVRRVIEILTKRGVLKTKLKIDQLLVQLRVLSPLASAFKAERAERYVQWVQIAKALGGDDIVHLVTKLDMGLAEVGADLGIPPHLINTIDERTSIQNTVKQMMAKALAAAQQQQQTPPPPNGDPAQGANQGAAVPHDA